MTKKYFFGLFSAMFLWVLPIISFAQDPTGIGTLSRSNEDAGSLVQIVLGVARWLLVILGVVAVIMVLVSAFRFVTGGDNEEQTTKAKKTLIWAIVGVVVAIIAFSIVTFANSLLEPPASSGGLFCSSHGDCPRTHSCDPSAGICIPN